MAKSFDMLMDVSLKKFAWNFLVFVVCLWEAPNRYNPKEINSIEMILQDSQARREDPNFDKRDKTKTTMNRWTLNFSHRTVVVLVENPTFPLQAFRLTQILKLLNADRINDSQVVDIMGEVVEKEDPRKFITSEGKEPKCLAILVEDIDNYRIGCVLFENMVDQILPYLDNGRVETLIVVLQFFRSSRWNGNDIITVMECRGRSESSNDAVQTNFLISRIKYMESRREHLVHRTWQEHVNVKTITMHSDGLYMV
ncbi:uncharacterized protein DS421_9g266750 [Arachis hypogaea]|nr:uncharacterized protein DS421_9g266750 [Arachis hypogaea]